MEQILDRYRGSRVSATVSYTERKRIIENRPRFFLENRPRFFRGGTLRNAFIQINNRTFNINPRIHGFKTYYYGVGYLRK